MMPGRMSRKDADHSETPMYSGAPAVNAASGLRRGFVNFAKSSARFIESPSSGVSGLDGSETTKYRQRTA
jgi:hypothetical protein